MKFLRRSLITTACVLAFGAVAQTTAQAQPIKISGLYELSGAGCQCRHQFQERR